MKDIPLELEPGVLPTRPAPLAGERMQINVAGLPPFKDTKFSIRNRRHPHYAAFVRLRQEATKAMAGRRWYDGAISMTFTLRAKSLDEPLIDYVGGIMDSLDGSHGDTFTYLPIVYQDDCQVCGGTWKFIRDEETRYIVEIDFL
jgi:hypothetical protein